MKKRLVLENNKEILQSYGLKKRIVTMGYIQTSYIHVHG
jgi:hypothetical protein